MIISKSNRYLLFNQVRLTAMDEEFIAIYSCLLPLEDGTCAKSGLLLDIHSKNKQVSFGRSETAAVSPKKKADLDPQRHPPLPH